MNYHYLFRLSFLLLLFSIPAIAQYRFQINGYNSWAQGAIELPGGNLLYVGYGADGGGGGVEAHVVKLAPNGTPIWRKRYHMFNGSKEYFFSCARLNDGTYMLAGSDSYDSYTFKNLILVRTDSMGNELNSYAYGLYGLGAPSNYTSEARKVLATSDNKVIAAGHDNYKGYLLKTDYSGKVIWGNTYDSLFELQSVIETTDKNYVAVGSGYGLALMKTDTNGTVLWCKRYFGAPSAEVGYDVKQTPDGGFIMVGNTNNFQTTAQQGIIVIKADSLGNQQWFKVYGAGTFFDYGNSVELGPNGGYIIGGSTQQSPSVFSQGYVFGIDSVGNLLWSKLYTSNPGLVSTFSCGTKTSDQGYTYWGGASGNLYAVKMDSSYITGCFETLVTTKIDTGTLFTGAISPAISIDSLRSSRNYAVNNMGQSFGFLCINTGINSDLIPMDDEWVFPNPSEGIFTLQLPTSSYVEVLNCIGEIIFASKNLFGQSSMDIDLTGVKTGIYFIKISSESGTVIKKIIIH